MTTQNLGEEFKLVLGILDTFLTRIMQSFNLADVIQIICINQAYIWRYIIIFSYMKDHEHNFLFGAKVGKSYQIIR